MKLVLHAVVLLIRRCQGSRLHDIIVRLCYIAEISYRKKEFIFTSTVMTASMTDPQDATDIAVGNRINYYLMYLRLF
jgi:hypothetical protein